MEPFFINFFLFSSKFKQIFARKFFIVIIETYLIEVSDNSVFYFLFIFVQSECFKIGIYFIKHLWNPVNNFISIFLNFWIIIGWIIDDFVVNCLIESFHFWKVNTIAMCNSAFTVFFHADYSIFLAILLTAIFIGWLKKRTLKLNAVK